MAYLIDITGTCNLRCPSCPVGNFKATDFTEEKRSKGFIEPALFTEILDKIEKENTTLLPKINLYNWGEPLIHPHAASFIHQINQKGFFSCISSNLSNDFDLKEIVKASPSKFRISLSGFSTETYNKGHVKGDIHLVKSNMYRLRHYMNKYKKNFQVEVFYHVYRDNVNNDIAMMYMLCQELGFKFTPGWAYLMPLEKILAVVESRPISLEDNMLIQRLVVPIPSMVEIAKKVQIPDCNLRSNQMVINHDGSVPLCCTTYDPKYHIADSFLDFSHDELQAKKYTHPLCTTCMTNLLHKVFQYIPTQEWDRIGAFELAKMKAPYQVSMFSQPHLSNR